MTAETIIVKKISEKINKNTIDNAGKPALDFILEELEKLTKIAGYMGYEGESREQIVEAWQFVDSIERRIDNQKKNSEKYKKRKNEGKIGLKQGENRVKILVKQKNKKINNLDTLKIAIDEGIIPNTVLKQGENRGKTGLKHGENDVNSNKILQELKDNGLLKNGSDLIKNGKNKVKTGLKKGENRGNDRKIIIREFEEKFWPNYPVKKGKAEAIKAFIAARKKIDIETLLSAISLYREELSKPNAPIGKYAQGWLNSERWRDYESHTKQVPLREYAAKSIDFLKKTTPKSSLEWKIDELATQLEKIYKISKMEVRKLIKELTNDYTQPPKIDGDEEYLLALQGNARYFMQKMEKNGEISTELIRKAAEELAGSFCVNWNKALDDLQDWFLYEKNKKVKK